jgi:uncharacterized protein involved in exopolysaccharide biosynthesis
MSDTHRFDLIDIAQTLQRRRGFIFLIAILAAVLGAAAWLVGTRKYKAYASVLVANPLYSDRNNLFRNDKVTFVDYFGREDDIDKVLAVAKSDQTHGAIMSYLDLAKIYKLDTSKESDRTKLSTRFKKSFEIKRTEYQNVEFSYTDPDPALAAYVANTAVKLVDEIYSGYYNGLRLNARRSLESRLGNTDSMISSLTDSLAGMRDRFHIYDILSPTRMSAQGGSHAGGAGYGRAIEEIQNIEATKDQLVSDRARIVSLINEFSAGTTKGDQPQIQVISPASVPDKPAGLNLVLTAVVCLVIGLLFSTLWVLVTAYYRALVSVQR